MSFDTGVAPQLDGSTAICGEDGLFLVGIEYYDQNLYVHEDGYNPMYKCKGFSVHERIAELDGSAIYSADTRGFSFDSSGNVAFADNYGSPAYYLVKHVGFTTTLSSCFTSPINAVYANCFDGSDNFIYGSTVSFKKASGFSATVSSSFTNPHTQLRDCTWDGTDLWICGYVSQFAITQQDGFSATVKNCFLTYYRAYGIAYCSGVKTGDVSGSSIVSPVITAQPAPALFDLAYDSHKSGTTAPFLYIRGSSSTFGQFDASPTWERYDGEIQRAWTYVQLRIDESTSSSSSSRSSSSSSSSTWGPQMIYTPSNTTDGDTVISDSSPHAHVVTKTSDPEHKTTTYYTATSSIRLDGNDAFEYEYGAEYKIDTNIDFWLDIAVYFDSISGTQYIISKWDADDSTERAWRLILDSAGGVHFTAKSELVTGGSDILLDSTTALQASTWYRIIVIRTNGSCYLYIDSTLEDTDYSTDPIVDATLVPILVGAKYSSTYGSFMTGYVDEIEFQVDNTFSSSSSSSSSSSAA